MVDQLSQTPSKISILSLLLCSEAHRNALMKLLNSAFVPQEISVNQFEGVIANITAGTGLGFTDFDLPPKGKNHNKALHISIKCTGVVLSRVLVDTSSSLNVLPKTALMKLNIEGVILIPSDLVVRDFDGSKRSVFGEVELPIKVGPHVFNTTFFVMDIQPAYCCLLGRLWIHAAGAVTSTLHQKMKFVVDGKVVTVGGEEDIMVSHLRSYRYVEVEGEVHETPFQPFETVQVMKTRLPEDDKTEVSMTSLREARAVVESGHPEGWGRVLDLPVKKDRFGIGYKPTQKSQEPISRNQGSPVVIKFSSAGIIQDGQVLAVDDDADSDYDMDNWIQPCAPNQELPNWTSEDIVPVTLVHM